MIELLKVFLIFCQPSLNLSSDIKVEIPTDWQESFIVHQCMGREDAMNREGLEAD